MKSKIRTTFLSLLLAAVLLAAGWQGLEFASAQGAGDPGSGTVVGIKTVQFAAGSTPITTTTYYYGSGNGTVGLDTQFWHSGDLFVTADVSGTNTITVTPQWSADGSNWVSAKRLSEGWVTSTAPSSSWVTYRVAISADGSDAIRFPIWGRYMRFMAEISSAVSITPTINLVLRNDGGH